MNDRQKVLAKHRPKLVPLIRQIETRLSRFTNFRSTGDFAEDERREIAIREHFKAKCTS